MRRHNVQQVKGPEATRLRNKKVAAQRAFRLPEDGLPGSLSLSHRRCGKASCRCAHDQDAGHPQWVLTFMVDGKKRVEAVPADWVEDVQRKLAQGQAAKRALNDILTANAELLGLERRARAQRRKRKKRNA